MNNGYRNISDDHTDINKKANIENKKTRYDSQYVVHNPPTYPTYLNHPSHPSHALTSPTHLPYQTTHHTAPLHSTTPHTTPHYTTPHYTNHHVTPHHTTTHHTTPHHTTPYYTSSYHIALHHTTPHTTKTDVEPHRHQSILVHYFHSRELPSGRGYQYVN